MSGGKMLSFAALRREFGIDLATLRKLEAAGLLVPLEWTGPRSGLLLREDVERFIAERHERSRLRVQQRERRRAFVRGPTTPAALPDFLRRRAAR